MEFLELNIISLVSDETRTLFDKDTDENVLKCLNGGVEMIKASISLHATIKGTVKDYSSILYCWQHKIVFLAIGNVVFLTSPDMVDMLVKGWGLVKGKVEVAHSKQETEDKEWVKFIEDLTKDKDN